MPVKNVEQPSKETDHEAEQPSLVKERTLTDKLNKLLLESFLIRIQEQDHHFNTINRDFISQEKENETRGKKGCSVLTAAVKLDQIINTSVMSSEDELIADEVPIENHIEQIESNLEVERVEADNDEGQAENEESKKVVKPKRVVRNPQPKLNANTLRGPKGLSAIQGYFEKVKFKGRGYEEQDLNVLMKTYEYWCHRLFPKYPFDACIARLETLGTKRATISQINRIRMDLDVEQDKPLQSDEEHIPTDGFVDATSNIQVTDTPQVTQEQNQLFDQLLPSTSTSSSLITEEQLERIQQNKERAERLRREKLNKINEKAVSYLEPSMSLDPNEGGSSQDAVNINLELAQQNDELASVIRLTEQCNEMKVDDSTSVDIDHINEEDDIDNILDEINRDDSAHEKIPVVGDSNQQEISNDMICINGKTSEDDKIDVTTVKTKRKIVQRIESDDEDSSI